MEYLVTLNPLYCLLIVYIKLNRLIKSSLPNIYMYSDLSTYQKTRTNIDDNNMYTT